MTATFFKNSLFAASLLAVSGGILTACSNEEDDIFSQSAAERLNSVSEIYSQRLASSKGGWVREYYPSDDNEDLLTGTGYLILNRFHDNYSVFTAMKNKASYGKLLTDSSAWEVVTYMGPVLSYNSHNSCLGRFSDPDDIDLTAGRYDDESGKGFQGDYEFVMVDVPENGEHIMLKGVKRGLYQRLTRLPEGTDFEAYLDDIESFRSKLFVKDAPWEYVMTCNGKRYHLDRQYDGRSTIYEEGKDSITYGEHIPFLLTKQNGTYHWRFRDAYDCGDDVKVQEFAYNEETDCFEDVNGKGAVIVGADPSTFFVSILDKTKRWQWTRNSTMSESFSEATTALANALQGVRCTLTNLSLRKDKERVVVRIQYRSSRGATSSVDFAYTMKLENGNIVLNYEGVEEGTSAQTIVNTAPAIEDYLRLLSQTFTVKGSVTGFNLSSMRLTSTADANLWFDVTLY